MNYSHILIRFAELNTKGKNKKDFINTLYSNIRMRLKQYVEIAYIKKHDRIYLNIQQLDLKKTEEIRQIIKEIPGISSFSFVHLCERNIESMVQIGFDLINKEQGKTFKIKTKRIDKTFPHRSDEINRLIAREILRNTDWTVDVHTPDVTLQLEIREEIVSLFAKVEQGEGGLPLGVSGKALLLLSGGIDSPVAGHEMMRRGVKIEAIHFASPPYTSSQSQEKVIDIAKKLARFGGKIRLYIVNFTKLQEAIYELNDESYAVTLMRRMMYRIAEQLALKKRCLALVSGESLGQVASQTLESMRTINPAITLPMLRPLVTRDKNDIIALAKKIDTYEISIRPYEDCCTIFTPKNPTTKPKIGRVEYLEKRFDYQALVDECVHTVRMIDVDENYEETKEDDHFL